MTERKLIQLAVKGKESAMDSLYHKYERLWYRLCLRYADNSHQAQDIFQEGLFNIFKDLKQFNADKGKFSTWSGRVLVHAALRYIRKNQWQQTFEELDESAGKHLLIQDIIGSISARELIQVIQKLPTGYRIIFNMYELEGYTHKEIAEQLDISIGTSKSQLSKAKSLLRKKIDQLF